jgi:hypothetical protein
MAGAEMIPECDETHLAAATSAAASFSAFLGQRFSRLPAEREAPMSDHEHEWSGRQESASLREGWFIQVGCYGARIRAVKGEDARFRNDAGAVAFVLVRAVQGDELALNAVRYLALDHDIPFLVGTPPTSADGAILIGGGIAGANDPST